MECEILVLWPGIKCVPPVVEGWCFNHWTAREVPRSLLQSEGLLCALTIWDILVPLVCYTWKGLLLVLCTSHRLSYPNLHFLFGISQEYWNAGKSAGSLQACVAAQWRGRIVACGPAIRSQGSGVCLSCVALSLLLRLLWHYSSVWVAGVIIPTSGVFLAENKQGPQGLCATTGVSSLTITVLNKALVLWSRFSKSKPRWTEIIHQGLPRGSSG